MGAVVQDPADQRLLIGPKLGDHGAKLNKGVSVGAELVARGCCSRDLQNNWRAALLAYTSDRHIAGGRQHFVRHCVSKERTDERPKPICRHASPDCRLAPSKPSYEPARRNRSRSTGKLIQKRAKARRNIHLTQKRTNQPQGHRYTTENGTVALIDRRAAR